MNKFYIYTDDVKNNQGQMHEVTNLQKLIITYRTSRTNYNLQN